MLTPESCLLGGPPQFNQSYCGYRCGWGCCEPNEDEPISSDSTLSGFDLDSTVSPISAYRETFPRMIQNLAPGHFEPKMAAEWNGPVNLHYFQLDIIGCLNILGEPSFLQETLDQVGHGLIMLPRLCVFQRCMGLKSKTDEISEQIRSRGRHRSSGSDSKSDKIVGSRTNALSCSTCARTFTGAFSRGNLARHVRKEHLGTLTAASGRLKKYFKFFSPSYSFDTACSSSVVFGQRSTFPRADDRGRHGDIKPENILHFLQTVSQNSQHLGENPKGRLQFSTVFRQVGRDYDASVGEYRRMIHVAQDSKKCLSLSPGDVLLSRKQVPPLHGEELLQWQRSCIDRMRLRLAECSSSPIVTVHTGAIAVA